MKAVYEYSAVCFTPEGNRMSLTGEIIDEDSDGFPPPSVAERARAHIEKEFPGVTFRDDRIVHGMAIKSYPSVRKLKGKTKALQKRCLVQSNG